MSSILKVDTIQTTAGAAPSLSSLGLTQSGTVLQQVYGACDGRTVSGVTFENVTALQALTASHADITGSTISYTPPTGTKTVVYTFSFHFECHTYSGISHYQFNIDGTDVSNYRRTHAGAYETNAHPVMRIVYEFPILIDSTLSSDDIPNLKLKSWTSARTLKMTAREYDNNTYNVRLHTNQWWDGDSAGANDLSIPTLSIKAIA